MSRSSTFQGVLCILGGFVIGVLARQMAQPEMALAATAVSLVALVGLTGMRIVARRKQLEARRLRTTRAALDMETRLHRHVSRIPRPHLRRAIRPAMERQYLPVVTSGGRKK